MVVSGDHMAVGHRSPSSVSLTTGENAARSLVLGDYTVSDMLLNQNKKKSTEMIPHFLKTSKRILHSRGFEPLRAKPMRRHFVERRSRQLESHAITTVED